MTQLTLNKIVIYIIALVAVFLFVMIIFKTTNPLKTSFSNLFFPKEEQEEPVEASKDLPFYSEFVKNYKECKLSPSIDCYCKLTNPSTPQNYVIELQNQNKQTLILQHANANLEDCSKLSTPHGTKKLETVSTNIPNDELYFISTGWLFSDPSRANNKLQLSDFTKVNKINLHNKKLCTPTDVSGTDSYDIEQEALIYKFDQEKTTFIFKKYPELKKCETQKDIVPAYDSFDILVSTINKCTGTCTYAIQNSIPEDYILSIENNKIILKYKGKELKSAELKKKSCLYTHYSPQARQNLELNNLELNNYLQLEIYSYENKICFLPYDINLAQQKKVKELKESTEPKTLVSD